MVGGRHGWSSEGRIEGEEAVVMSLFSGVGSDGHGMVR